MLPGKRSRRGLSSEEVKRRHTRASFLTSGGGVNRTEAGAAAGVRAGVERARAALARAGPVLELVRRAREAIPPPLPVLEVPHVTRGASAV